MKVRSIFFDVCGIVSITIGIGNLNEYYMQRESVREAFYSRAGEITQEVIQRENKITDYVDREKYRNGIISIGIGLASILSTLSDKEDKPNLRKI